ncbi:MAG: DUF3852 family protein [Clostridiales bacterium]|nr:DUF3852 family protein [Clostridiales bacterium]
MSIVNNVVFPVIDLILAALFFTKIGLLYMDYRKHGQFEFTAPLYIWSIIRMLTKKQTNFHY